MVSISKVKQLSSNAMHFVNILSSFYLHSFNAGQQDGFMSSVALWLGCQSLAGRPPASNLWLTGDHFVGELSAMGQPTKPTQLSTPPASVLRYMYLYTQQGWRPLKRQTTTMCGCLAAVQSMCLWAVAAV